MSADVQQTHLSVVHKLQVALDNCHVAWQPEYPVSGHPVLQHEEVNAYVCQLVSTLLDGVSAQVVQRGIYQMEGAELTN